MEMVRCTGPRPVVGPEFIEETERPLAVHLRNARLEYAQLTFDGPKRVPVLNGFNMEVPVGCIYGLLGASGCGKTTVLQSIVGQRKLSGGSVAVFGVAPRTPGSGVPGPAVGYMPQELALPEDFTIGETMTFFAWLVGMSYSDTKARLADLSKLLDLPSSSSVVRHLSGGQQRRVSFAVALLHDPPLLILDEPTVGLDPILRQGIWQYLVERTADRQTTVIITTHYIEEAREAHRVGLLRGGRLLDEDTPDNLLSKHGCHTLEDVLLKLCLRQQSSTDVPIDDNKEDACPSYIDTKVVKPSFSPTITQQSRNWKIRALLWKDLLRLRRNTTAAIVFLLLGALQSTLFCLGVGLDPKGLRVLVQNDDADCAKYPATWQNSSECGNFTGLSCTLIEALRKDPHVILVDSIGSSSLDQSITDGFAWGSVYFNANFSSALQQRILLGDKSTEHITALGSVEAQLDMSHYHAGLMLKAILTEATYNFTQQVMTRCDWPEPSTKSPVRFNKPVYGTRWPLFQNFAAPGMILSTAYVLSCVGALSALLPEKRDGLISRSLVAGVSYTDILLSQQTVQLILSGLQTVLMLGVMWGIFDIPRDGNIFAEAMLCLITTAGGMWLGFFFAVSIDNETIAAELAIFSFFSFTFLSGMFWPIEGMIAPLRWYSYTLPLTLPSTALRDMMARGWSIFSPSVLVGYSVAIIWVGVFVVLTAAAVRLRNL